ncbi:hypothetical protein ACVTMO_03990 [Pseudomonas segetis]
MHEIIRLHVIRPDYHFSAGRTGRHSNSCMIIASDKKHSRGIEPTAIGLQFMSVKLQTDDIF